MKKERQSNFELMRIISMFSILAFHYQIHIDSDTIMYQAFSKNQFVAILAGSWGTLGTNLFFIVTSYFLIESCRYDLKKIKKLMIKTSFFAVVLLGIAFIVGYVRFDLIWLIKSIFAPFTYMYWFISAYIILYVFSPILNRIIDGLNIKEYQFILIVLFWVVYIMPLIIGYFDLTGRLGCAIFIYFFMGYLLKWGGGKKCI